MKRFEILIPEIKSQKIRELLKSNQSIGDLSHAEQTLLISIAIKRLNAFYNCKVIDMDNLTEKEDKMPIWIGGLSSIRPRNLFSGLLACIDGQTEYVNTPPPNVISFRKVCVNLTDAFRDEFPAAPPKPIERRLPDEERIKMMKEKLPRFMWPREWRAEHAQNPRM